MEKNITKYSLDYDKIVDRFTLLCDFCVLIRYYLNVLCTVKEIKNHISQVDDGGVPYWPNSQSRSALLQT